MAPRINPQKNTMFPTSETNVHAGPILDKDTAEIQQPTTGPPPSLYNPYDYCCPCRRLSATIDPETRRRTRITLRDCEECVTIMTLEQIRNGDVEKGYISRYVDGYPRDLQRYLAAIVRGKTSKAEVDEIIADAKKWWGYINHQAGPAQPQQSGPARRSRC